MPFTDRYISLPIRTYDRKIHEITGKSDSEESYMKITPFEIQKYRPTYDEDDPTGSEIVSMTDKSGDTTLVYLTVKQFEDLLNNFSQ